MFYIKKNKLTGRYEVNLFGIKMKFNTHKKNRQYFDNLLYELADPRTLEYVKLPKVMSIDDSLYALSSNKKSLARFGDGEFKLINGENISFQKYDPKLAQRLADILRNQNDKVLVGITDTFGYCPVEYHKKIMIACRETLYKYMNFSKQYANADVTRRLHFVSEEQGNDYYKKLMSLWENKNIITVEGEGSRLGIGNDLFDNALSVKRILGPIRDSYSRYDEILEECLKQPKEALFILALGPSATILAEDLANAGYRALDMGHFDITYEAFLRKSHSYVPIEGKIVFNEERHRQNIKPCPDKKYYEQIIAKFVD